MSETAKSKLQNLLRDGIPLVVGVVADKRVKRNRRPVSDLVELRVDLMPKGADWIRQAAVFEKAGCAVIVTVRDRSEGGRWEGNDARRLRLYEEAVEVASAVDVEFKSRIARKVARLARARGKVCILSFHDFERTPSLRSLKRIVRTAQRIAGVVKVTSLVKSEADVEVLRQLLARRWKAPLCVMGMGPLGVAARIELATLGSCFVYGYLDRPVAPGQHSAREVVRALGIRVPGYRTFRQRGRAGRQ